MSTLRLLKEDKGEKAGAVVTRPFHEAKRLVAAGVAERVDAAPPPPKAAAGKEKPDPAKEIEALKGENEALKSDLDTLRTEHHRVVEELKRYQDAGQTQGKDQARAQPADYDAKHVDELRKEAADRNLEGRSALTTKDDLVKALKADDRKGKK